MSSIFKNGITIPKIIQKLELSGYAPELKGEFIEVWVNLTRVEHQNYTDLQKRMLAFQKKGVDLYRQLKKVTDRNEITRIKNRIKKFEKNIEKESEPINDEMYTWYANIWGQGKEKINADQVRKIAESSKAQDDSVFWAWITKTSQAMILAHRNQHLKN